MEGVGQEEDEAGVVTPSVEPSYLVPNSRRDGSGSVEGFLDLILSLAQKYDQYGIIYGKGDSTAQILKSDGTVESIFNSFRPAASTYYSKLKGGRSFHFESVQLHYVDSTLEGMAHSKFGQHIYMRTNCR